MKKLLFLTWMLSLAAAAGAAPVQPLFQPARGTGHRLFVLEIHRSLRGAQVAVQHSNGELVLVEKIRRKRVVIDFTDVAQGTYTIELRKGIARQVHLFTKK